MYANVLFGGRQKCRVVLNLEVYTVELPNNGQIGSRPFVLYIYGGCPFSEAEKNLTHN